MPIEVRIEEDMEDELVEEVEVDEASVVMVRHRTTSSTETEKAHAFSALQVVGGTHNGRPPKASPSSSMSSDQQSDSAGSVPLSVKTSSEGSNFQVAKDSPNDKISPRLLEGEGGYMYREREPVIWDRLMSNESTTTSINTQANHSAPFPHPGAMFEEERVVSESKEQFLLEDDNDHRHWNRVRGRMAESSKSNSRSESPPHKLPDTNHFGMWSKRWQEESGPASQDCPQMTLAPPRPAPTLPDFNDMLKFHRIDSAQVLCMDSRKPPKIIGHYLFGARLGEGSYGKVKECLDTETLCRRACKIMKHDKIKKIPNGFEHVKFEITQLQRLKHPNIIRLYDVLRNEKKGKLYLVMEYCVCSLQGMLDNALNHRVEMWQAQRYFTQLIDGLQYLHGMGVVHKDIKPGNLLLTPAEQLKITDYGTSDFLDYYQSSDIVEQGVGTPKFQPPEIAGAKDGSPLRGFPVDMWACGVTLYNMASGEWPFEGTNEFMVYNNISRLSVVLPSIIDHEEALAKLILGLLNKNPKERMTIRQVRQCDWFRRRQPRTTRKVALPCIDDCPMTVYPCLEQLYGSQVHSPVGSHPSNELLTIPSVSSFHPQRKLTTGSMFEGDALTFSVINRQLADEEDQCRPRRTESECVNSNCTPLVDSKRTHSANVEMSSTTSSSSKLSSTKRKARFCKHQ